MPKVKISDEAPEVKPASKGKIILIIGIATLAAIFLGKKGPKNEQKIPEKPGKSEPESDNRGAGPTFDFGKFFS